MKIREILNLMEGIYDPGIFKAVFLGGGPGSGKSYTANNIFGISDKSNFSSFGLKLVSSDISYVHLLKKSGFPLDIKSLSLDIQRKLTSLDDPDSPKIKSRSISFKQYKNYIEGRLGLIFDGTAKNIQKITSEKQTVESLGYDAYMIFVYTDLNVALERNNMRERSLPDSIVTELHAIAEKNRSIYKSVFGSNYYEINNSSNNIEDFTKITNQYSKIFRSILSKPVKNPIAVEWINNQLKNKRK